MGNHWFDIWSNRGRSAVEVNNDEFQAYCALKKADGFDVAVNSETIYFMNFYKGFLAFFEKNEGPDRQEGVFQCF